MRKGTAFTIAQGLAIESMNNKFGLFAFWAQSVTGGMQQNCRNGPEREGGKCSILLKIDTRLIQMPLYETKPRILSCTELMSFV